MAGEDRETTIIDGGSNGSVIRIHPVDNGSEDEIIMTATKISGFTIQNGYANNQFYDQNGSSIEKGGGLFIKNSSPSLDNLIVKNNLCINIAFKYNNKNNKTLFINIYYYYCFPLLIMG